MEEEIGKLCHQIANWEIREPQPTQPTTPAMGTMHFGAERIRHPNHGVQNQDPQQPSFHTRAEAKQRDIEGVEAKQRDIEGVEAKQRDIPRVDGVKGEERDLRQAYVARTSRRASSPRANGSSKMDNQVNAKSRQDSAASATTHRSARTNTRIKQSEGTQHQPPK